jgi:hypothetical protein
MYVVDCANFVSIRVVESNVKRWLDARVHELGNSTRCSLSDMAKAGIHFDTKSSRFTRTIEPVVHV